MNKIEPPNWWVRHSRNPVQLLLTGSDLNGAAVLATSKGFRMDVRQSSADGRYLFAYLTIDRAVRPGRYRFRVRKGSEATAFDFALDAPPDPTGRFQGITGDDVIYLIMPDRFANGDPSNDSPPEYNRPADRNVFNAFHGGDLRGIRDRLPYLNELGVTALWLNPIYKNSSPGASPYHGYHTVDFYDVEPRFGSMKDFRNLVDAAHRLGVKVLQDQVANHTGPRHPWVTSPPTPTWFHHLNRTPRPRNNFDIAALADPYARPRRRDPPLRGWFAGNLPDLDQTDPLVSDYLIQNALWWIGMSGLDGIRQDTYPYADRPFWEKWQTAIDREYPALVVVGEITAPSPAVLSFFQAGARRDGVDTRLRTMLDFPLEGAVRRVFAQGQPMTQIADVLAQDFLYHRPELLVTFIGNHDGPRFFTIAANDAGKLLMAQTLVLTTRRVPQLYYGDEIAMGAGADRTDRSIRADFPGGFPGDPVNAFLPEGRTGTSKIVFDWTRDLLRFRQAHPALRRGDLVHLLATGDQYVFLRRSGTDQVLVALNRAGSAKPIELDVDDLAIREGTRFRAFAGAEAEAVVSNSRIVLKDPKEISIYWAAR